MLARLFGVLVRVLLETALMLVAVAALLSLLAFRTSRRLVVSGADPFERLSGPAATLLGLFAARSQGTRSSGRDETTTGSDTDAVD